MATVIFWITMLIGICQEKQNSHAIESHMLRCFETGEPKACCWLADRDVGFLAKMRCGK